MYHIIHASGTLVNLIFRTVQDFCKIRAQIGARCVQDHRQIPLGKAVLKAVHAVLQLVLDLLPVGGDDKEQIDAAAILGLHLLQALPKLVQHDAPEVHSGPRGA